MGHDITGQYAPVPVAFAVLPAAAAVLFRFAPEPAARRLAETTDAPSPGEALSQEQRHRAAPTRTTHENERGPDFP